MKKLLLFLIVIGMCLSLSGCELTDLLPKPVQYMPEEGVWYCEDLQIQLSFEANICNYVLVDNVKVEANWHNDPGAKTFSIMSAYGVESLGILPGYVFLTAECVSRNEDEFVVKERYTDKAYVFRQREDPLS